MSVIHRLRTIALLTSTALSIALLAACLSSQGKLGTSQVVHSSEGTVVEVTLKEYEIDMPDSLPAGPITFRVTNTGSHDHTLRIEGSGVDSKIEPNLKGGESKGLKVALTPGKDRITWPVGPHVSLGMRRTLTVTQ